MSKYNRNVSVNIRLKQVYVHFQKWISGKSLEEMALGVTYEKKTSIFLIECAGHVLNSIIYSMLLMGSLWMKRNYLIPFIAHCIAGISLFLGATEASFYLGLQCFKGGEMEHCRYTMMSGISIVCLVCVCVFLTYSRKLYLEIKKNESVEDFEETEQEEGLLKDKN